MKRCPAPECLHINEDQARHCAHCGAGLANVPVTSPGKLPPPRVSMRFRLAMVLTVIVTVYLLSIGATRQFVGGYILGGLMLAALIGILILLGAAG